MKIKDVPRYLGVSVCRVQRTSSRWSYRKQPLAVLNGLTVFDVHLDDLSVALRVDLVHQLHRFDDAEDLALLDLASGLDESRRAGLGGAIERADDRRLDEWQDHVFACRLPHG